MGFLSRSKRANPDPDEHRRLVASALQYNSLSDFLFVGLNQPAIRKMYIHQGGSEEDITGMQRVVRELLDLGTSEEDITRVILTTLIEQGVNPLADAPPEIMMEAFDKYLDIVILIMQKFGAMSGWYGK